MEKWLKKLEREADKAYVLYFLAGISFLESIIFPVPIDIFTFSLASVQPKKWIRFGSVATIFSVLGSVFGYFLGYYLFQSFGERLIHFYHYETQFQHIITLFYRNTFIVMFTSAFTPIPFKVFTIAGGAAKVSFIPFISASLLGRGLRFFIEVYLAQKFGKKVAMHIMKRINIYSLILVVITLIYLILF